MGYLAFTPISHEALFVHTVNALLSAILFDVRDAGISHPNECNLLHYGSQPSMQAIRRLAAQN